MVDYFDSDVIINAVTLQDPVKHEQSKELIFNSLSSGSFAVSTLTIQEVAYVLARLNIPKADIEINLDFFSSQKLGVIEAPQIRRALNLAKFVGYKSINDCIHTAVAESLNCEQLFTYNAADFTQIGRHSRLLIRIL